MWAVLGATVGIAALVNHEVRQALHIPLAPEEQFGTIVAQLPKDWEITPGSSDEPGVIVRAKEPGDGARQITVRRQRIEALISPEEFLLRDPIFEAMRETSLLIMPSPLADRPGMLGAGQWEGPLRNGVRETRKLSRICTIMPSRQALVLEMSGHGILTPADILLTQQIAAAMQTTGEAWPEEGVPTVELAGRIVAGVPEGYQAVVELDPNRISRSMIFADNDGQWSSVELIPCVFFSEDSADTLRSMLLPHGMRWLNARVSVEAPGVWRIDPTQHSPYPRRAYLMSRPNGQAMLAIFRAGMDNEGLISPAWAHIRSMTTIPDLTPYSSQVEAGISQAEHVREMGLASSIPTRGDQWWLWYQNSAETYLGETRMRFDPRDTWKVELQSKWTLSNGAQAILGHTFESDASMSTYRSSMQRVDNEDRPGRTYVRVFDRIYTLDQKVIRATLTFGRPLRPWEQAEPDGYVPGGWLGLVLGAMVSADPVILQTDTLMGCEEFAPMAPLTVLVRPCEPGELPQEVRTQWPVCLNVQVNGSSEVMRWHFSNDDQLQQVDFAGGIHRIRSDEQTVTSFSRDPAGTPELEQ